MPTANKGPLRKDYRGKELLQYVEETMAPESKDFERVLERSREAGLPEISIGPLEGLILRALASSCGTRKAVEIGTLGGYSAHWIAGALPAAGRLYSFELDEKHASVARESLNESGLSRKVTVIEGDASKSLAQIEALGPFDFCFIDADKVGYPGYLRWAAKHLRPGGLVALDNAFLFGKLHLKPEEAGEDAPAVRAMRECMHLLTDPRYFRSWCMVPTGEGMAVGVRSET